VLGRLLKGGGGASKGRRKGKQKGIVSAKVTNQGGQEKWVLPVAKHFPGGGAKQKNFGGGVGKGTETDVLGGNG